MTAAKPEQQDADIVVAMMYLRAFDQDSIQQWIRATNAWNDRPYSGRLGRAVQGLRNAWYHDGSQQGVMACAAAAAHLRSVIEEMP